MSPPPKFSLFIPFWDEKESLPVAIDEALRIFGDLEGGFELLLIDDGSSDGSSEIAQRYAEMSALVRVLHHPRNLGYGAALASGFGAATGDFIGYSDVDLPTPLEEFLSALQLMEEDADIVIGYPTGGRRPLHRRVYTWGYNRLVQAVLRLSVRDANFSFKLLRRSLVERVELSAETGFIDAQLLAEARRLDARLVERPVPAQQRKFGTSHFDSPIIAVRTGVELIRWKLRR